MARFTFKFIFTVILLLFGILMGMNIAEKGLYKVVGNPDADPQSLQILQKDNQLEVKVLGKTYISDLPEKSKPIKTTKESNSAVENKKQMEYKAEVSLLSSIGNKLGNVFQKGAEKGLNLIARLMN